MTDNPFDIGYREPVYADDPERSDCDSPADVPARFLAIRSGIHRLAAADYHADPAPEPSLSATLAKLLVSKSPAHAWHASPRLNPDWEPIEKKTFDIGRAAHRAVLGAGDDYVAIPEEILGSNGAVNTKEAKAFVADCREAGRTPLKQAEVEQIDTMAVIASARLMEHSITLDPARSELAAIAQIDGIWCRAMFDNVPADPKLPIYDFKTCENASPEACLRAIVNYSYDIQAAHYRATWKAATGEDRGFVFIFQEKPAPHEVTLISLSGSFREFAERRAAKARKLWGECISADNWPGYPTGLHEVDPPAYLIEREFQEEYA